MDRNHIRLFTAAAIAVASMGIGINSFAQSSGGTSGSPGTSDKQDRAGMPSDKPAQSGQTGQESADAQQVKQAVSKITQAALKGDLNQLTQYLNDADAKRLGNFDKQNEQFKQVAEQIRTQWQQKYSGDFDQAQLASNDTSIRIVPGDLGDAARLAGERVRGADRSGGASGAGASGGMGGDTSGTNSDGTARSGSGSGASGAAGGGNPAGAGASGASGGMSGNTVSVVLPPSSGMAPVSARFVKSGNDFKLDIPDTVDAQKLADNLQKHLTQLQQQQAQWPSDQGQAFSQVTHHILAALTDADNIGAGAGLDRSGTPSGGAGSDRTGTSGTGTGSDRSSGTGSDRSSGGGSSSGSGASGGSPSPR